MSRLLVLAFFGLVFINISCEKCTKCRYSYTETIIVPTPNGEEEEIVEHVNLILLDADGSPFGQQCFKRKEYKDNDAIFTIETYYELEKEKSNLDNFDYECVNI